MTVALTTFQQTVMSDVIRQHEAASVHTPYCCETVARYQAQLAGCTKKPSIPAQTQSQTSRNDKSASEKQINFIAVLLKKKVATTEELNRDLSIMTSTAASQFIKELMQRDDNEMNEERVLRPGKVSRPASQRQLDYITSLAGQRDWPTEGPVADIIRAVLFEEIVGGMEASLAIERLLSFPKVDKPETGEEGVYFFEGEYYKVQRAVHGSGRLYSKKFDLASESWSRGGSVSKLTDQYKITAEQAKAFGDLYGRCIRCSAILTEEESIERGAGPICAEKMGF
jgi:hypothetical protein